RQICGSNWLFVSVAIRTRVMPSINARWVPDLASPVTLVPKWLTLLKLCHSSKDTNRGGNGDGPRQEVDHFRGAFAGTARFAGKIHLNGRIAREFSWPISWPAGRFLSGQLRLSRSLRIVLLAGAVAGLAACD